MKLELRFFDRFCKTLMNNYKKFRRGAELNKIDEEIKVLEITIAEFKNEIEDRMQTQMSKELKNLKRKRNKLLPLVVAENL